MASKAKVKLLAEMAIDAEVDLGMTGSADPLAARLYVSLPRTIRKPMLTWPRTAYYSGAAE